ncbi:MAG: hypothetical protein IMZ64_04880 [Bacteroidetes bacterium]|nr:hypothetical protein [Bacteroidota bacterium]
MEYYFSKTINASFDEAINRITEALKTEGFGIVSEIRMLAVRCHSGCPNREPVSFRELLLGNNILFVLVYLDSLPIKFSLDKQASATLLGLSHLDNFQIYYRLATRTRKSCTWD